MKFNYKKYNYNEKIIRANKNKNLKSTSKNVEIKVRLGRFCIPLDFRPEDFGPSNPP